MRTRLLRNFLAKATVRTILTFSIIGMWIASFLVDMANPKYDPPDYINPLIMLVAGYMFATTPIKRDKGDK